MRPKKFFWLHFCMSQETAISRQNQEMKFNMRNSSECSHRYSFGLARHVQTILDLPFQENAVIVAASAIFIAMLLLQQLEKRLKKRRTWPQVPHSIPFVGNATQIGSLRRIEKRLAT